MSLCFVLIVESTFLNIEELQKSKYGVEISAEPVLLDSQLSQVINIIKFRILLKI